MPSLEIVELENARPYGENVTRNERVSHMATVSEDFDAHEPDPDLAIKKAHALLGYMKATERARRVWRMAEAARKCQAQGKAARARRTVVDPVQLDRGWR